MLTNQRHATNYGKRAGDAYPVYVSQPDRRKVWCRWEVTIISPESAPMECERFKKLLKTWYIQVQSEALAPARMVDFMENHVAECPICLMDPEAKKDIAKIITLVLPQEKLRQTVRPTPVSEDMDDLGYDGDDSLHGSDDERQDDDEDSEDSDAEDHDEDMDEDFDDDLGPEEDEDK